MNCEEPVLTNTLGCDSEHQLLQHQTESCRSNTQTRHRDFREGHTSREAQFLF